MHKYNPCVHTNTYIFQSAGWRTYFFVTIFWPLTIFVDVETDFMLAEGPPKLELVENDEKL